MLNLQYFDLVMIVAKGYWNITPPLIFIPNYLWPFYIFGLKIFTVNAYNVHFYHILYGGTEEASEYQLASCIFSVPS